MFKSNKTQDPKNVEQKSPTPGGTKGALKGKGLEDGTETKFKGLSKHELLKVANTRGWKYAHWALIILFVAGWIGLLVAAVLLIVHAPRCVQLPHLEWWQTGALYQIGDIEAFQDSDGDGIGDLAGVQRRMDYLEFLKVKGLVIGPIHTTEANLLEKTHLKEIDRRYGTHEIFQQLVEAAQKKSIRVILDLTPNYKGANPWFKNSTGLVIQKNMKEALHFWLQKGVSGIRLGGIQHLEDMNALTEWKNIMSSYSTKGKSRILFAVTDIDVKMRILEQLNKTSFLLLSSRYLLEPLMDRSASVLASRITEYLVLAGKRWPSWSIGGPNVGHMASLVHQDLMRICHILLFTLPGTPFTTYGDEIGLEDLLGQTANAIMHWDDTDNFGFSTHALPAEQAALNRNISVKVQKNDDRSLLALYRKLSNLKQKELSLLHGAFRPLPGQPNSKVFAYMRVWNKNERILVALNFGTTSATVMLQDEKLPADVTWVLSSEPRYQARALQLEVLELGPHEGLLMKFPADIL